LPPAHGFSTRRCTANPQAAQAEADLQSVAGTSQIVSLAAGVEPKRGMQNADEKPVGSDPYVVSIGLTKIRQHWARADPGLSTRGHNTSRPPSRPGGLRRGKARAICRCVALPARTPPPMPRDLHWSHRAIGPGVNANMIPHSLHPPAVLSSTVLNRVRSARSS
jgi:hypothetical protein